MGAAACSVATLGRSGQLVRAHEHPAGCAPLDHLQGRHSVLPHRSLVAVDHDPLNAMRTRSGTTRPPDELAADQGAVPVLTLQSLW